MTATDFLAPILADRGFGKLTALPAQRVVFGKHASRLPARGAGNAVMARLDAGAAHRAGLGVDECQSGVVERTQMMDRERQIELKTTPSSLRPGALA